LREEWSARAACIPSRRRRPRVEHADAHAWRASAARSSRPRTSSRSAGGARARRQAAARADALAAASAAAVVRAAASAAPILARRQRVRVFVHIRYFCSAAGGGATAAARRAGGRRRQPTPRLRPRRRPARSPPARRPVKNSCKTIQAVGTRRATVKAPDGAAGAWRRARARSAPLSGARRATPAQCSGGERMVLGGLRRRRRRRAGGRPKTPGRRVHSARAHEKWQKWQEMATGAPALTQHTLHCMHRIFQIKTFISQGSLTLRVCSMAQNPSSDV
jgi:hypothetical protein